METLNDLLASFPKHADKLLFRGAHQSLSYTDAHQRALALAASLRGLGMSLGDTVLLTLENSSAFPVALLGVVAAGCTVILGDRETGAQLLAGVGGRIPTAHIHDHDGEPCLKLTDSGKPSLPLEQLPRGASGVHSLPPPAADRAAVVVYTSASSGVARGVVKTHANLMVEVADLARILARRGDRFLSVLPWSYIYGLLHHLLVPMFVGGTAWYLRQYTPRDIVQAVAQGQVDLFIGVPALYRVLAGLPAPLVPGNLTWAVSSGAPLDDATALRIGERLGWPLVEFYGSTESGGISFNPDKLSYSSSVGHPMPHIEVRGPTGSGGSGVLEVRGPTVSDWAYEGSDEVRLTDDRGWYRTNDTGHIDSDGRLYLQGRLDRLIKVAGRRVSLDSIEAALLALPGVVDAAVGVRIDRIHGEVPVADVVFTPGSDWSVETLMQACRNSLPPHKRPRQIVLCRRIDRKRVGKAAVAIAALTSSPEES